ncbi:MAG: septal ring lytic transglycosylase RlpA family protein [Rhodonellum sp.]|nr:septal ring lytic transglycosylase RlpA family protein [Rhodonellum sp.]
MRNTYIRFLASFFIAGLLITGACKSTKNTPVTKSKMTEVQGKASFYANRLDGKKTANGEIYNAKKMTAAHPTLPFGTQVEVTNLSNGKTVRVRINDRGPFRKGRIIDLSRAAAEKLDMIKSGVTQVEIRYR